MNMRKMIGLAVAAVILITAVGLIRYLHPWRSNHRIIDVPRSSAAEGTKEDPQARARWEWLRLRDPKTGSIPAHIASREMAFARELSHSLTSRSMTGAVRISSMVRL